MTSTIKFATEFSGGIFEDWSGLPGSFFYDGIGWNLQRSDEFEAVYHSDDGRHELVVMV